MPASLRVQEIASSPPQPPSFLLRFPRRCVFCIKGHEEVCFPPTAGSYIMLSRGRDCFIIAVLRHKDLGRRGGGGDLFYGDRSVRFSLTGTERGWRICPRGSHSTDIDVCACTSRSARSACIWETFSRSTFSSFLVDSTSSPFSRSSLSRCSFNRSMIRSWMRRWGKNDRWKQRH